MAFPNNTQSGEAPAGAAFSCSEGSETAPLFSASADRSLSGPRPLLYGSTEDRRSVSVPPRRPRRALVAPRTPRRGLTVSQHSRKISEEARKNLFSGSFASRRGALFLLPPKVVRCPVQNDGKKNSEFGRATFEGVISTEGKLLAGLSSKNTAQSNKDRHEKNLSIKPDRVALKKEKDLRTVSFVDESILNKPQSLSKDACMEIPLNSDTKTRSKYRALPDIKDSCRESTEDLLARNCMREEEMETCNISLLSPETIEDANKGLNLVNAKKFELSAAHHIDAGTAKGEFPVKGSLQTPHTLGKYSLRHERCSDTEDADSLETYKKLKDNVRENEEEEESEDGTLTAREAMVDLLSFAAPAAVTIGFTFALLVVPLAFVGSYLGEREFTGASIGYFIVSMVAIYPISGSMFAMDTLCSHEFGRDNTSQELGLLLQRGILVNLFFLMPICFLLYRIDSILVMLYGKLVAEVAAEFLHYIPIFLVPVMMFIAFTKFLSNQMQPQMPMVALTAGFIITPFVQMYLTPMGVRYTMVGMAITAWWQLLIVLVMTLSNPRTRHTLGNIRIMEALRPEDVKEYLVLSIPSSIFVAAEASSFDVTGLLCAHFGEAEGAAWSGVMNALVIFASVSGGLSASACANIGRSIGSYKPLNARMYVSMAVVACLSVSIINSFIFFFLFDRIMSLFGTRGPTLALARNVIYILPFFHIADSVQFAYQGIFSGLGKNHVGAAILLGSLWGVGIPLAFLLGMYLGYGILGVCLGITVGLCIEAPAMVLASRFMDYEAICESFAGDYNNEEEEEEEEEVEVEEI